MAKASMFVHELNSQIYNKNTKKMGSHINIGTGKDVTIKELANSIKEVVGYKGQIVFDLTKSDGAPRKLLNIDLITKLGWKAETSLKIGLSQSYHDYLLTHHSSNINDVS